MTRIEDFNIDNKVNMDNKGNLTIKGEFVENNKGLSVMKEIKELKHRIVALECLVTDLITQVKGEE